MTQHSTTLCVNWPFVLKGGCVRPISTPSDHTYVLTDQLQLKGTTPFLYGPNLRMVRSVHKCGGDDSALKNQKGIVNYGKGTASRAMMCYSI